MESAEVTSRTLTFKVHSVCRGSQKKFNKIKEKISGVNTISYNEDEFTVTFTGTADPCTIKQQLAKITKYYVLLEQEALPVSHKMAKEIATGQEPVHEMEAPPQVSMESPKVTTRTLTFKVHSVCQGSQKKFNKIKEKISGVDTISYNEDEFTVTFTGTADPCTIKQQLAKITKYYVLLEQEALPVSHKMAKEIATGQEPVHEMEAPPQDKCIIKIDQPPKHEHRLKLIKDNKRFACNGCKMDGFDERYRCKDCSYELHEACYEPKASISHKFFPELTFHFCNKAPSNSYRCVACGNTIQGFFYRCGEKAGLYLHPSCSKLPAGKFIGDTTFALANKHSSRCMWCKKKKGVLGWFYVSSCNKYHLHVHCITQLQHEAWKKVETEGTCGDASTESNEELIDAKLRDMLKRKGRSGLFEYWKPLCSFLRAIIGVLLGDVSGIVPTVVAVIQILSN